MADGKHMKFLLHLTYMRIGIFSYFYRFFSALFSRLNISSYTVTAHSAFGLLAAYFMCLTMHINWQKTKQMCMIQITT